MSGAPKPHPLSFTPQFFLMDLLGGWQLHDQSNRYYIEQNGLLRFIDLRLRRIVIQQRWELHLQSGIPNFVFLEVRRDGRECRITLDPLFTISHKLHDLHLFLPPLSPPGPSQIHARLLLRLPCRLVAGQEPVQ